MPVYNYFTVDQNSHIIQDNATLVNAGPIINIEIGIPEALANYYQQKGIAIPQPVTGYALIDTGCTLTSVDDQTVQSLGLKPVGTASVGTAGGQSSINRYPAHVKFPGTNIEIDYNSVMSAKLDGQQFKGTPIIALVGRDILSACIFIYNGITGMYTFAN